MSDIYLLIKNERKRQIDLWGLQSHDDGTGSELDIKTSDLIKSLVKELESENKATWKDILYEEVHEVFAEKDLEKIKEELIQVAAVAVAWVEDIDRKLNSTRTATLKIGHSGNILSSMEDSKLLIGETAKIDYPRLTDVEWENGGGMRYAKGGWTVRLKNAPYIALRHVKNKEGVDEIAVSPRNREFVEDIVYFGTREEAINEELKFFQEFLNEERKYQTGIEGRA